MEHKDRNDKVISVGNKVKWYDPNIENRDLTRIYEVYAIFDEHICIADDYSEAEVFAHEVEIIN